MKNNKIVVLKFGDYNLTDMMEQIEYAGDDAYNDYLHQALDEAMMLEKKLNVLNEMFKNGECEEKIFMNVLKKYVNKWNNVIKCVANILSECGYDINVVEEYI